MTYGNDTYEWSVEEIEALCRVAGIRTEYLGWTSMACYLCNTNGVYIGYGRGDTKSTALIEAWNHYVNNRRD
jgi:hypothetical protein